jgi:threonylcarbamoyladenosine tRNA methylthiotransferase MtaB
VKKVAFYTLGCKLNFSETSTISRQFEEKGFLKVDFQENPDIFIINTCSVTDNADKKCKKLVKEAKKISPDSYIAIIGCYAQLKPTEIAEIEGVDAVLGAAEKFRLLELLDGFAVGVITYGFDHGSDRATGPTFARCSDSLQLVNVILHLK